MRPPPCLLSANRHELEELTPVPVALIAAAASAPITITVRRRGREAAEGDQMEPGRKGGPTNFTPVLTMWSEWGRLVWAEGRRADGRTDGRTDGRIVSHSGFVSAARIAAAVAFGATLAEGGRGGGKEGKMGLREDG